MFFRTAANRAVIDNFASGIDSTRTWTRIYTFLIYASSGSWTLGANNTFRSARGWAANVGFQAGAHSMIINIATLTIWSTWRRTAGILLRYWFWLFSNSAMSERIAGVARWTRTNWNMIYDITTSILSASTRAWINALISYASFISAAFCTNNTLRSAGFIWISDIFLWATTYAIITQCVWSTRRRVARIFRQRRFCNCWF